MRLTRPAWLVPLATLVLASLAPAQGETGFLRGEGRLDLATTYSLDLFDEVRLENPVEEFDDGERAILGLYAAYGLTDDLDLVLAGSYQSAEADGEPAFDDESDLQDLSAQLKWRVHEQGLGSGTLRWLLAPGVRLPLTDYEDYSSNPLNGLGEGDTVLLGRLIAHYDWRGSYAALETGYDRRNGPLDDEIPLHLSLGTTYGRVTYQAFATNLIALGDEVSSPRLSDERDGYVRLGLGAYVRVSERFGLSLSVRASDDGTNESQGFSLGTVFRF
jgi:hypothetical protein